GLLRHIPGDARRRICDHLASHQICKVREASMGGSNARSGVRFHSWLGDGRSGLAGVDFVRRANGEAKELGAGTLFPARVASHRSYDFLRSKSEVSGRLPSARTRVAPEVDTKQKSTHSKRNATLRKNREREAGIPCRRNGRTPHLFGRSFG